MSTEQIFNHRRIDERVITAGHPTEQQLRDAAAEGVTAVINLAPIDHRSVPAEAEVVRSLGMAYDYIPVDWQAPTAADFTTFEHAMQAHDGDRVLIHCAANFRVTAFYSLYALKHLGWSAADAEALRASIWDGSDHPVWQTFIESMTDAIERPT
ncbi:MAG TPA: protein tyrosine phosphatase family protein [Ilumatobacteraceae bacterium]